MDTCMNTRARDKILSVKPEPAEGLLACRICLATNTKLYGIHECCLDDAFVDIMGTSLSVWDGFPQHVCGICRTQLRNSSQLRQRCQRAQDLLRQALTHQDCITTSYLATLDRVAHRLTLCLSITHDTPTINISHDNPTVDNARDIPDFDCTHDAPTNSSPNINTTRVTPTKGFTHHIPAIDSTRDIPTVDFTHDIPSIVTTHEDSKHEVQEDEDFEDFDTYHPEFDEPIINLRNKMMREKEEEFKSDVEIRKEPVVKKVKKVKKAKRVKKGVKKKVKEEIVEKKQNKCNKKSKGFKKFFASDEDYTKFENTYNIEITKLSEEEQLHEMQARKESSNYLRSAYKCERCFKGFLSETTYENHLKKTHEPSNGRNECSLCGARFRHPAGLRKHFESHTLKFTCKICQFVTRHRSMATMHADFHSGKTFVCKYCGITFNKQTTFNTHTRVQHPLENASAGTCHVCGETFTGKRGLQQHKAIAHKKLTTPELKCRVCLVQFDNVDAKARHKENNVCDPRLTACPTCGETFPDENSVKNHVKDSHGQEHYQCDQCDATFSKKSSLAVHFERVHLNIKPKKPAAYRYHQYGKGRHKMRHAEICEICGKGYPDTTWLRYHQRTHTGERPYKCAQCPKRYMTPAGLQRHAVVHTGVRRWQCSQCPKTFLHQSSIYTHKLVHTGEKPHVCHICSKAFTQSGSLSTHVKYVHMKEQHPPKKQYLLALPLQY